MGGSDQESRLLVSALLGELHKKCGSCIIRGTLAYVPQQAWIMSGSIRDNILFGKSFDLERYKSVLGACALDRDLELWSAGDKTEIGERGINLSGGQKQRISLARAVYADADIYILDDVLSALDMQVDSHIFQHVIGPRGLLRSKTRILVTHGIHHLKSVDYVLVMKAGSIAERGKVDSLEGSGELASLAQDIENSAMKLKSHSETSAPNNDEDEATIGNDKSSSDGIVQLGVLTGEEAQVTGSVGSEAYWQYTLAFGIPGMILCCFLLVFMSIIQAGASWWLGYWSSEPDDEQQKNLLFFLGVYVSLIMAVGVVSAVADFLFRAEYGLKAATVLHDNMLESIIGANVIF